ncbi:hypothetical protein DRO59_00235 [Candidatus Bathyarchaeota archaeon]|nr:MAG: hypothetical protein DRO59_00235 [Candidatus Bathyarchaeota archaeon]
MDKRRKLVTTLTFIAIAVVACLVAYAVIQYFGQMVTEVPVEQAVWVDGKRFNETITETLPATYGGCTVYAEHILENKGDEDAQVEFVVVSIVDSEGNSVNDNSVEVYFMVDGQKVDKTIVPSHQTITFQIAIHFHYAIMPDTYTVTTQVKPYVP